MFQQIKPHLIAILSFILVSSLFYAPALKGKKLESLDNISYFGAAKEALDYEKEKGEMILWTNRVFGGMPMFQISYHIKSNVIAFLNAPLNYFPLEISMSISLMLGMYICFLLFGTSSLIATFLSIGFGLSTWFLLSIEAGHNSKMYAIAYLPLIFGGMYQSYYSEKKWGLLLIGIGMALMINTAHFQIVFYGVIISIILGIFILLDFIKQNKLPSFIKTSVLAILMVVVGALCNTTTLWTNFEYAKETMRGGKSELSENKEATKSGGLDIEYAFRWSYGVKESLNMLIPDFMGGGNNYNIKTDRSKIAQLYRPNDEYFTFSYYWGDQPFTSGPTYLGAIVLFLFLMYMLYDKSNKRWILFSVALAGLIMAWGRHFSIINDILFNYVPMYNKFRTPSMALTITTLAVFLGAGSFVNALVKDELDKTQMMLLLKKGVYIIGGVLVAALFIGYSSDFHSATDVRITEQSPDFDLSLLYEDRKSMLMSDLFRSLFLIAIAAGVMWAYLTNKLKKVNQLIMILGVLIVFDLFFVGKRYLNETDYKEITNTEEFIQPTAADMQIMQDKNGTFRVFNTTTDAFNDNSTGYFHNNVGGYSAAKLFRYQDIIQNQLGKGNMSVFNMLNTRYFITAGQDNQPVAQMNSTACGNSWFVQNIKWAKNADEEMSLMNGFEPKSTVIIDERFKKDVTEISSSYDSTSNNSIVLSNYHPDKMKYAVNTNTNQFAVFSEIWYNGNKDWKAYIDGKEAKMVRVNYLLRGLNIPAGAKEVVFEFRPDSFYKGNMVGYGASLILILMGLGMFFMYNKKENKS